MSQKLSDVKIYLDVVRPTFGDGENIPLIYQGMAAAEVPYTVCEGLEEVLALFDEDTLTYKAAQRIYEQNNAPRRVAVCASIDTTVAGLPSIIYEAWRQLIVVSLGETDESTIPEIAAYIDSIDDKLFFASVRTLDEVTGGGNVITEYMRTYCLYYPDEVDVPEAAVVGATAGKPQGTINYRDWIVGGLTPSDLTETQLKEAEDLGCYCIVQKAGDILTSSGQTGNGDFLDHIESRDYTLADMQYRMQKVFNMNDRVPYDNTGIALLEDACRASLGNAFNRGLITATDSGAPAYKVNFASRSEISAEDRVNRHYPGGQFEFVVSNSIDTAAIHGVMYIDIGSFTA